MHHAMWGLQVRFHELLHPPAAVHAPESSQVHALLLHVPLAVNTLGAFALTAALEPALHAAGQPAAGTEAAAAGAAAGAAGSSGGPAGARVIFVSSGGQVCACWFNLAWLAS